MESYINPTYAYGSSFKLMKCALRDFHIHVIVAFDERIDPINNGAIVKPLHYASQLVYDSQKYELEYKKMKKISHRTSLLAAVLAALLLLSALAMSACAVAKADLDKTKTPPESDGVRVTGKEAKTESSDEQLYRYEFEDEIAYVGLITVGGPVIFTENAELNAAFIEMLKNMRLTKLERDEYVDAYVDTNYWEDYEEDFVAFPLYSAEGKHLGFVSYNRALDENSDASLWSSILFCFIPTSDDSIDHGIFVVTPETFDVELIEQFYQECTKGLGAASAGALFEAGGDDEFLTSEDIQPIANYEDSEYLYVLVVPAE